MTTSWMSARTLDFWEALEQTHSCFLAGVLQRMIPHVYHTRSLVYLVGIAVLGMRVCARGNQRLLPYLRQ